MDRFLNVDPDEAGKYLDYGTIGFEIF